MTPMRLDTSYGPLEVTLYAGPTNAPGSIHANDGKYPSAGHAFGRDPGAAYVGARVRSPETGYRDGVMTWLPLRINGVDYRADAGFELTAAGWRYQYSGLHPLRRGWSDDPTDAARKLWTNTLAPFIVGYLGSLSAEVETAKAEARAALIAEIRSVAAALRAEADRLEALVLP